MIIYCIEDINDNKYIGSTKRELHTRLTEHRYKQRNQLGTTSQQLNLYNCIIYELEQCEDEQRNEREQYWIDNTDCVNINNIVHDYKEYQKQYFQKNKEKKYEYYKQKRKEAKLK